MPTKTCWKCHGEMEASRSTCPHCSAKVGQADARGQARKPTRWVLGCGLALGGLFVAFTVLVVLLAVWGSKREAQRKQEEDARERRIEANRVDALKQMPAKEHLAAGEAFLKRWQDNEAAAKKYLDASLKNPDAPAPDVKFITKDEEAAIRTRLGYIGPDQPEYPKAQALLHQMADLDAKSKKEGDAWAEKARVATRKDYAKELEQRFIDQRMDVDVTVSGKDNTVLNLRYVLANKVVANDISESGLIKQARERGFKKVRLSDGYKSSWEWDLTRSN